MAIGRKTGGRKPGTPNKATAEIRDAAQRYTGEALGVLCDVMRTGASEQARIAAANSILDRGWGRPAQSVDATIRRGTDATGMTYTELLAIANRGRGEMVEKSTGALCGENGNYRQGLRTQEAIAGRRIAGRDKKAPASNIYGAGISAQPRHPAG